MARTVVGYISANGLNNMASASPTGSIETVTGLPIQTGNNPGNFRRVGLQAKRQHIPTPRQLLAYSVGQLYELA